MSLTGSIAIALMSRADALSYQWVHIIPAGSSQGRDGRGPYKLTNPDAVIAASRERAGRAQMPIDYDHAIDLAAPNGGAAPAAGWIKGLQSRADGIWGLVDWTPRAAEQLGHREYRYLSPVFNHTDDGTIACILRASLTNNPNLDQLTALASMETTDMDKLPELRKALGMADDATIDAILTKISELTAARQSAAPDPTKFVPIGDFERTVAELRRVNQGVTLQAATDHVAAQIYNGKLPPFLKDWGISLCSVNKPEFDNFIGRTGGVYNKLFQSTVATIPPSGSGGPGMNDLTPEETAIASNMGLSPEAYLKTKAARGTA
jgi:phage I-like protein